MGKIVIRNIVFILVSFVIVSCSLLQNGFTNEYGQYVPKHPRFKLKDKSGFTIPENLDTVNIYRLIERYDGGKLVYPKSDLTKEEYYSYIRELQEGVQYIKFYANGRCLSFTISAKDKFGNPNQIKETDLNPNNTISSKNYYYPYNSKNIQIETFAYGDGHGHYVISDYILDNTGNTLISEGYFRSIYKKETIPLEWNKYKVDL